MARFYIIGVTNISEEMKIKIEIFFKFPFFYQALSSCCDSPQLLSIIYCTAIALSASTFLLFLGLA